MRWRTARPWRNCAARVPPPRAASSSAARARCMGSWAPGAGSRSMNCPSRCRWRSSRGRCGCFRRLRATRTDSRCATNGRPPRPIAVGGGAPRILRAACCPLRRAILPSPYLTSDALIETLLQWVFRRACFDDAEAPRARRAFEQAVDQGRARLHSCLQEIAAGTLSWFNEARAVRRSLDAALTVLPAEAADESSEHLRGLLGAAGLESLSTEWLRQLPRYLKAEERRWQRNAARGGEPQHIVRELRRWSARHSMLANEVGAELRWIPELDEFQSWIEEYRVSLYAQELKTVGPISAARLEQRAAEIEAWWAR